MGNATTTERDSARMRYGNVLAIDSYCGCCADWHSVQSSPDGVPKGSPQRGSLYRHYKGGLYTVLGYATWPLNLPAPYDHPSPQIRGTFTIRGVYPAQPQSCRPPNQMRPSQIMVVYLSVSTGAAWVRDLDEWNEEVEVGGATLPRFQHFSGGEG